ncbi:zinc finger protein 862-like [Patiria miniata]|uniref:Uncharacterized protein n=1 Tax=Patiria miniata TaxID=46514 RepID=A0A914AHI7_PATMI|nr:zinc finger protein 862-like [Patiria miniata]
MDELVLPQQDASCKQCIPCQQRYAGTTGDGLNANITLVKLLGVELDIPRQMKTMFPHPCTCSPTTNVFGCLPHGEADEKSLGFKESSAGRRNRLVHSVKEEEIVYLRTASQGVISNDFVGLAGLEKADAQNICSGVLKCCQDHLSLGEHELMSKMVGFESDGASVMLGCNSGVSTLLKQKQRAILEYDSDILQSVHCFNHRLELGYKDTLKKVAYQEKVYHYSHLNRSMLKRSCDSLGVKFLAPSKAGSTRWLPHMQRALDNLWVTYPAIVQHCQQLQNASDVGDKVKEETKAKAKGFLDLMLTKRFVLFCHFLTDVVLTLSKLSLKFQSSEMYSAASMKDEVELVISYLDAYRPNPGP